MDKRFYFFAGLALVAGLIVSTLQGCDLRSLVSVSVPPEARTLLNVPQDERITYADAPALFAKWENYVKQTTTELSAGIESARERYELLQSVADTGMGALSEEVGSLPGGGLLIGALGGLGGLFINKPGTKKRENKQKQVAYAHGVQAAKAVSDAQE